MINQKQSDFSDFLLKCGQYERNRKYLKKEDKFLQSFSMFQREIEFTQN